MTSVNIRHVSLIHICPCCDLPLSLMFRDRNSTNRKRDNSELTTDLLIVVYLHSIYLYHRSPCHLGNNTVSCILTVDISDHFPVLLFLKNKNSKPNRKSTFSFRKIDNVSTDYIKRLLQATDWWTMHSLCVDEQSEFLSSKIQEYIDLYVPLKTVTIGHRYVIREKWMTKCILKSSLNLNKLRSKISKK